MYKQNVRTAAQLELGLALWYPIVQLYLEWIKRSQTAGYKSIIVRCSAASAYKPTLEDVH